MSAIGRTSPVGEVTWSIRTKRVRSVTAEMTESTTCLGESSGNGTSAITTLAPVVAAAYSSALRHAL